MSLSARVQRAQRRSLLCAKEAARKEPKREEKMRSMSGAALSIWLQKKKIWKSKWNKSVCIFEWSCWPASACCCLFHLSLPLPSSRISCSFARRALVRSFPFHFSLPSVCSAGCDRWWISVLRCAAASSLHSADLLWILIIIVLWRHVSLRMKVALLIGDAAAAVQKKEEQAAKTTFSWYFLVRPVRSSTFIIWELRSWKKHPHSVCEKEKEFQHFACSPYHVVSTHRPTLSSVTTLLQRRKKSFWETPRRGMLVDGFESSSVDIAGYNSATP